jgi:cytidylate kinase
MSAKILISGASNSGKTTLTQTLTDALIISHDGKNYPFALAHVNIPTFDSVAALIAITNEKVGAYKEKTGSYPKTIVFDSVSKIFDTLMDNCNKKFTGFNVYSNLNKEINEFTAYIQNTLIASEMNVVLLSHAIWDADTAQYNLVGKGDFAKRGKRTYCLAA